MGERCTRSERDLLRFVVVCVCFGSDCRRWMACCMLMVDCYDVVKVVRGWCCYCWESNLDFLSISCVWLGSRTSVVRRATKLLC